METGLVFIHGAGLGEWVWDDLRSRLDYPSLAIHFPEKQKSNSRSKLSLHDYTSSVDEQINEWDEAKQHVIIGHSIGGCLGVDVASKLDTTIGFLGICAAIPKNQKSFLSTLPLAQRLTVLTFMKIFGTKPPETAIRKSLCNGLEDKQINKIVEGWTEESINLYTGEFTNTLKCSVGYVQTIHDKEFNLKQQTQMASNLVDTKIYETKTGHMPMLQEPVELAKIVETFLEDIR